jgi:hypothetical protein
MLFAFFLSIQVVWFSCEFFQRQQLLEALAREVQLAPYFPIMPQLWRIRLDDHQRAEDLSKQYEALQQAVKLSMEYPNWAGDSFTESELKKQGKMVHKVLS